MIRESQGFYQIIILRVSRALAEILMGLGP